ncbi:MAG: DUF3857 and transglutaminase domain-containing protein [Acidobacteriia bacterium]|nr:DUF3857 and transglutaminase domain-containing protein [Terriglobia bacterium]
MNSRLSCNRGPQPRRGKPGEILFFLAWFVVCAAAAPGAAAGDAPAWMHALVNAPLPAHDEKTDAVLLYSEEVLSVQANGKIKGAERRVYKILRPDGKGYGTVRVYFDSETRITNIHGWCIPAQGKDYEVKEKEASEMGLDEVENGILFSDDREKVLRIPAAEPGNIVGYELEHEDRPYVLQDRWVFQHKVPTREARYTLQLPEGWRYKAMWRNHAEVLPTAAGNNQWQWVLSDIPAIKPEARMPPWPGIEGQMIIALLPPGGGAQNKGLETWGEVGLWVTGLTNGRRDASPAIKQKAAELTTSAATPVEKMRALAQFMQREIRYVAISLGIGGYQPHPAGDVFSHRYGDCKDKATLLSAMLKEIGVDSYYVVIDTQRGKVTADSPATPFTFNHMILAIRLPEGVPDPSLAATLPHAKLGRILFFDPTDTMTPFGQLRGPLQGNYGLLVAPEGGELTELPKLPAALNGIQRTGKLALDGSGTLKGEVREVRVGDSAGSQRWALRTVSKDVDRIKPIETLLAHSLGTFRITKATVSNAEQTDRPFIYEYSLVAENYGKAAGNLLLVRPRVLGSKALSFLETKEARKYPVEFEGPARDTDTFEITLPPGYEVDDLPPPVDAEYSFASYHSKTEASGNVVRYTRVFEVKQLSVPLEKVGELRQLYRVIFGDERNTAVLKPAAK